MHPAALWSCIPIPGPPNCMRVYILMEYLSVNVLIYGDIPLSLSLLIFGLKNEDIRKRRGLTDITT